MALIPIPQCMSFDHFLLQVSTWDIWFFIFTVDSLHTFVELQTGLSTITTGPYDHGIGIFQDQRPKFHLTLMYKIVHGQVAIPASQFLTFHTLDTMYFHNLQHFYPCVVRTIINIPSLSKEYHCGIWSQMLRSLPMMPLGNIGIKSSASNPTTMAFLSLQCLNLVFCTLLNIFDVPAQNHSLWLGPVNKKKEQNQKEQYLKMGTSVNQNCWSRRKYKKYNLKPSDSNQVICHLLYYIYMNDQSRLTLIYIPPKLCPPTKNGADSGIPASTRALQ